MADGSVTLDQRRAQSKPHAQMLSRKPGDFAAVRCGTCIGCRTARARDWAIRARFEARDHEASCWSTLTYDDDHLPPTLQKLHVSVFLRRLRKKLGTKVRFLACGEYGELTYRPHYHAILYGVPEGHPAVQHCWPHGFAQTHTLRDEAIAYVVGYVSKKLGTKEEAEERVDPRTGEVYRFQPPFLLMSRRPGIGAGARVFFSSWRRSAIVDGREVPVPRYLHASWADRASPDELKALHEDVSRLTRSLDRSRDRLEAGEMIAFANRELGMQRRKL